MTTHLTDTQKQTIRIALAKWMGWKFKSIRRYICGQSIEVTDPDGKMADSWEEDTSTRSYGPDSRRIPFRTELEILNHVPIPNYPASLDACHEIEVKMTDEEHKAFRSILGEVTRVTSYILEREPDIRAKFSAKAEHRSLALFRALNLGELGD